LNSAPDNTLSAYRALLAQRAGFEFDIRRTKDKHGIVARIAYLSRK
jgi:glycerophosphoryl diester phosphodiesterase